MFRVLHRASVGWVSGCGVLLFFDPTVKIHTFKMHLISCDLIGHYRKINFL